MPWTKTSSLALIIMMCPLLGKMCLDMFSEHFIATDEELDQSQNITVIKPKLSSLPIPLWKSAETESNQSYSLYNQNPTKAPYLDSLRVFYGITTQIDSIIIFHKDTSQVLLIDIARAYEKSSMPLDSSKGISLTHCNRDDYLDLVVRHGLWGTGRQAVNIILYNPETRLFELSNFLSDQGSLCYNKEQDIYQSYFDAGMIDFVFRQFRVLPNDSIQILKEFDISPIQKKWIADTAYLLLKLTFNEKQTIDTIPFNIAAGTRDIQIQIGNLPYLQELREFGIKYRIEKP